MLGIDLVQWPRFLLNGCNGWMAPFGAINRWWSALGRLSWLPNILKTLWLVSIRFRLPLISFKIASSKVRLGVILVHLHWVEASSGTRDHVGCGILVTLGGCRNLDGLEAAEDRCVALIVAGSDRLIIRGSCAHSPRKIRKRATLLESWLVGVPLLCDSCDAHEAGLPCDAN